ncbi:hypothetical protein [Phytohabitans kaempferiae]|uniref:Uncharacterized protein n=1 Tax=Phytohabitans kaempferiae TaxID=1620943 RepID=A0ABV6M774_9ACTN
MDEKERYDTNREARHDAAADAGRTPSLRTGAMARFVGAVLYDTGRHTDRERKPQSDEDDGTAA